MGGVGVRRREGKGGGREGVREEERGKGGGDRGKGRESKGRDVREVQG